MSPGELRWSWFDGPPILEGTRNVQLTRIAGAMRGRGEGFDSILCELRGVNRARCRPPLRDSEVYRIALSVSRYRHGDPRSRARVERGRGSQRDTRSRGGPGA